MEFGVKSKSEIYKEGDNKDGKYERFQSIKIFGEVNKKESEDENNRGNFIFIVTDGLFSYEIHIDNKDKIREMQLNGIERELLGIIFFPRVYTVFNFSRNNIRYKNFMIVSLEIIKIFHGAESFLITEKITEAKYYEKYGKEEKEENEKLSIFDGVNTEGFITEIITHGLEIHTKIPGNDAER